MRKIALALLLIIPLSIFSQDKTVKDLKADAERGVKKDPNDTIPKIWKTGGLYSLNISQGSLDNWAAGGDKFSLSLNSMLNLFAFYKKGRHSWDNTFDFNLGYVKTTSLGSRKNDDRFDLFSKYGYSLAPKVSLAGVFDFRSQFFDGFTYDKNNQKSFSSTFLAPAYLLLGAGVDFKPVDGLSIFVSPITVRWVIVNDDSLSARGLYGVEPGEKINTEIGAFSSINYFKEFNKVLTYKGRLDLFSNYRRNPQNVDLYFTNLFNVKVSRVLAVSWSVDMIYDDDVRLFGPTGKGAALQLKSLIGIGLSLKF